MIVRHDAEQLASTAQGIGARVIRGPVHYPGHEGRLDVGGVAIEGPLSDLKDQEVLVIVAPLRTTREAATVRALCGLPYHGDDCPVCKAKREEEKRVVEERLLFDDGFSPLLSEG